jgi:hypothetical protein
MLNAIRVILSDLAGSKAGEDGENEDADEQDLAEEKLSKDNEAGWEIGTMFKLA